MGLFGLKDDANVENQSFAWSTEAVDEMMEIIETGGRMPRGVIKPFYDGNPQWRLGNIVFNYTDSEIEEIKKCAKDITYFAEKYCVVMTDEGLQQIQLRNYQIEMLKHFVAHRFSVVLASRQVGKCFLPSTSIYISKDNKKFQITMNKFWRFMIRNSNLPRKYKLLNFIKYNLYEVYSWLDKMEHRIREKEIKWVKL